MARGPRGTLRPKALGEYGFTEGARAQRYGRGVLLRCRASASVGSGDGGSGGRAGALGVRACSRCPPVRAPPYLPSSVRLSNIIRRLGC